MSMSHAVASMEAKVHLFSWKKIGSFWQSLISRERIHLILLVLHLLHGWLYSDYGYCNDWIFISMTVWEWTIWIHPTENKFVANNKVPLSHKANKKTSFRSMECFQNVNLENWMLIFVSYISGWSASGITSQPKQEREIKNISVNYSKPKQKYLFFTLKIINNSDINPCQFLVLCFPIYWQLLQCDFRSTEVHSTK